MQSRFIKLGTTDVTLTVRLLNATTFLPVTGLAITSIQTRYIRNETDNDVTISAWVSLTALTALTDAHTDNYGYEIGNGYYRVDIPDAVCAAGINEAVVLVQDSVGNTVVIEPYHIQPELVADVKTDTAAILTDTGTTLDTKINTIAVDVVGMDGITPPTAAEIKTALEANGTKLDHLWEMTEDDGGTRRLTENSLEQAPSGTGASAATIADAVWDETSTNHDTVGTMGKKIFDIWNYSDDIDTVLLVNIDDVVDDIKTTVDSMETVLNDVPTTAEFQARTLPQASYFDPAADTVAHVTLVDTTTVNTDIPAVKTETDKIASLVTAVITNATGTDIAADIIALKAETVTILADTNEIQGKLPTNKIMGSSDVDNHDTDIDSILADTNELQVDDYPTSLAAIKAKTDQLEFTSSTVNANVATGGIGTGAITVSYYVYSDEAETIPLAGVAVWVSTDLAGTVTVATDETNSSGLVTFYLDAGTYYMWRSKTGYAFTNPDLEVVE